MKVVVIGLGEVGQNIAKHLIQEGHELTIVDRDEERVAAFEPELDAMVLPGNGASPKFLEEIHAGRADLLLAVTQVDEVNVIAALAAHQLGAKRTVARVRDPDYFGTDAYARDVLGIDFVIHPERATASEIADAIKLPGAVQVEYFADGKLAVAETIISERSPIIGIPLAERQIPHPHFIVGIIRAGEAHAADAREALEPGDHVIVAASRKHIGASVAYLAGRARRAEDAVLFGGGKIGLHLASLLQDAHIKAKILEADPKRARFLAEKLPHALVLHEEGVGKDIFVSHGIDQAGAFVASVGDDRSNLLAAFYAKEVGCDLAIAVVSREEFVPLVNALNIDAAFAPRLITAGAIVRFLRSGQVRSMHMLLGGSEVIELQAEVESAISGRSIGDVELPEGCKVGAISRNERVIIPLGHEKIMPGDRVVIFGARGVTAEVEKAFEG
jgi:trk system potassium uptake protein